MKFRLLSLVLAGLSTAVCQADLAQKILERNGDVYVLVTRKNKSPGPSVGVYKFTRTDEYSRSLVGGNNAALQAKIPFYEGLAVDKFGHVKFFRNDGDKDASGNATTKSLIDVTEIHPSMPAGTSLPDFVDVEVYDGGGISDPDTTFQATPPGWAYVVETNGNTGWAKVYNWSRVPVAYGSGDAYLYDAVDVESKFSPKVEILPRGKDGGVNNVIRKNWHNYSWWHPTPNKGSYAVGVGSQRKGCDGVGSGGVAGGSDCFKGAMGVGPTFYPPINAYWVSDLPPGTGDWQTIKMRGRRIANVTKSVTKLYLDSYLTQEDNFALYDASPAGANPDARFDLKSGVDYFGTGTSDKFMQPNSALNTSVSFSQEIKKYNVCNDMCNLDPQDMDEPPLVINDARATFSSGGNSTQNQRSYMVKTASVNNGQDVTTWVVQFAYDDTEDEYAQTDVIKWDGGIELGPGQIPDDGVDSEAQKGTAMDPKRIVIYDKGDGQFARSVQSSKRFVASESPPDSKDYLYVSNLPTSHFNVSSSFWGTGGVVWWADENANSVDLHYEQVNHQTGSVIRSSAADGGPINAANVKALQAIGADGDNFIYILHAGGGTDGTGGVEGSEDMRRLFTPVTGARMVELSNEGRMINSPTNFPLDTASYCGGNPAGPCDVPVEMRVSAGLVVEKIAPLAGSKPVKIGIVPLTMTDATCTAEVRFSDPNAMVGAYTQPWSCEGISPANLVQDYNVEMAVINVANPPATGGDNQIDIADAAPSNQSYVEDTQYTFHMENPPAFDGQIAQLGLTQDPQLIPYGDVAMVSNYDDTGINRLQEALGCPSGITEPTIAGGVSEFPNECRRYFDHDGRKGILRPSYIYRDLIMGGANPLHESVGGAGEGVSVLPATKTLRWRWRVTAKTPPQSLHDFNAPLCEPLLKDTSSRSWKHNPQRGVMLDTCWQDIDSTVLPTAETVQPDPLEFVFEDPGSYEVTLMFGGLRFNADGLTFLDNPDSVSSEVTVTWYDMPVHVGAKPADTGLEIQDVVVAQNDLDSNVQVRADMPASASDWLSTDFSDADALEGEAGRVPVLPTASYAKDGSLGAPLTVTSENQRTPVVGEASVAMFRMRELQYLDAELAPSARQQEKALGVGAWDYRYPGGGSIPINGQTFAPVDKTLSLPPNARGLTVNPGEAPEFDLVVDDPLQTDRRGYDATGDPNTGAGFRFNASGTGGSFIPLDTATFEDAHQGTLATCEFYPNWPGIAPDNQCLLTHPESFYTWWEIKYAWLLRYRTPAGNWKKTILRTGNLGEVFLLNLLAQHGDSNWKRVIANLAPTALSAAGNPSFDDSSPFMKLEGDRGRDLRIRIPLMKSGALLASDNPSDEGAPDLNEMHEPLRNLPGSAAFTDLYKQIQPLSFKVPSGATVYELGVQLFYPVMNWEGREPQDPAAADPGYAYYDAIYWGRDSNEAGSSQKSDLEFTAYDFGQQIQAWRRLATQRISSAPGASLDEDAKDMGLSLLEASDAAPGGFFQAGAGSNTLSYEPPGGTQDDFAEFVVLDLKSPTLSRTSGGGLNALAGGRSNEDLELEATDNNPYSLWPDAASMGSADTIPAPAVTWVGYEIGVDRRNLHGLGFKQPGRTQDGWAFGFNLSHTSFDGTGMSFNTHPQYRPGSMIETGTPFSVPNPGYSFSAPDILSGFAEYYYPQALNMSAESSYWMHSRQNAPGAGMEPAHGSGGVSYQGTVERMNANQEYHYLPFPDVGSPFSADSYSQLSLRQERFSESSDSEMQMVALRPRIEVDPFRMEALYDGSSDVPVEFLDSGYTRLDPDCMEDAAGNNPLYITDPSTCEVSSRWRVDATRILAPYFMHGDAAQTFGVYAKARDVRVQPELNDFTVPSGFTISSIHNGALGADFDFDSGWELRQGMEDAMDHTIAMEDTSVSAVQRRIDRVLNSKAMAYATRVDEMTVSDSSAPNFRVILKDAKHRSKAEITVMGAQALDADNEAVSDRVFAFRTRDGRPDSGQAEDAVFAMEAFTRMDLTDADRLDLNMATLAGGSTENQVWRIPEDVRFEVRVMATDNRTLNDINIRISGGNFGSYAHPDGLRPVAASDSFPDTSTSDGRIYQQMKFASAFHEYPISGAYDVLEIVVEDEGGGNSSTLYVPIEIIRQNVSFNKIGSQMQRR